MMLNIDFEVFYDLPLSENESLATCDVNAENSDCKKAETFDLAAQYAEVRICFFDQNQNSSINIFPNLQNNDFWIAEYVVAYDIMTSNTDGELMEVN